METSKLFRQLGNKAGINPVRFTHRGIIARRIIEQMEELELENFKFKLRKISL